MAWPEDSGDGGELLEELKHKFPPPYDGEPADLRRDIADELADHLACAVARERERTGDETTALRAALERFGDPRALARKLWFEAMKERIMKDRIMFVSVLLLALAAVAGAVFSWQAFQQSQRANQAMLAALEKIAGGQNAMSKDKGELQVTVTKGDKTKTPVKGLNVLLNGPFFGANPEDLNLTTDERGSIKCGPMNPCRISLNLDTPPTDGVQLKLYETAVVFAGQQAKVAISYPELATVPVSITVDRAEDFKNARYIICGRLVADVHAGESHWGSDIRVGINTENGAVYVWHLPSDKWDSTIPNEQLSSNQRNQPVNWPALEYKLTDLALYTITPGDEARSDVRYTRDRVINLPVEQQPNYKIEPGKPNELKIKLPEDVMKRIQWMALLNNSPGAVKNLDPGLGELVPGRIRQVQPMEKICSIDAQESNRASNNFAISNDHNTEHRALFDWPTLSPEVLGKANRKFVLALWVDASQDSFGMASADQPTTAGVIGAYPILSDWQPNTVSWKAQPNVTPEPAMRYGFSAGKGWKLFDITPIVREQPQVSISHGVMLRFLQEGASDVQQSYYTFASNTHQNEYAIKPVLLVVDEKP